MNIAVIGGGASGVFFALKCKELFSEHQITIFERNNKLLKKIYATGNGKCNFANAGSIEDKFNNNIAATYINEYGFKEIASYFENIGISYKLVGDLAYPYSESADTVATKLIKHLERLGIKYNLEESLISYKCEKDNVLLQTNKGKYVFDRLVIATGGKSSPIFGSDGNLFNELKNHKYELTYFSPSLCPIKVKENVKLIEGCRHKVLVKLFQKNDLIHEENGELLFKKDGLSGIVIMNIAAYINRLKTKENITIHIDFVPDIKEVKNPSSSYLSKKLASYVDKNNLNIKDTVFTFNDLYDYDNSHVTSGGVSLKMLNKNLSSKIEPNVYFIGEVVDIDGLCGGYNLMWAFSSAYFAAKYMK